MPISASFLRQIFIVALGSAALALAACGDDGGDATPTATVPDPTAEATTTPVNDRGERVAADGDSVLVHYHGTLDDGEVFDSSLERAPLPFVVGSGGVIAGFDDAVRGLAVGEKVTVRIPPQDAYGEVDRARVVEFPLSQAPEGIKVGDQVSLGGAPATVTEVTDDTVTVDANHELAGKALTFEIELVEIR